MNSGQMTTNRERRTRHSKQGADGQQDEEALQVEGIERQAGCIESFKVVQG